MSSDDDNSAQCYFSLPKYGFMLCFEVTSHGVWLKSFIYGIRIVDSFLIHYCDNSATVFLANNNKSGSRSKQINIKYLAIRERVNEKKVVIEHVNTELMIYDPLTKGMPLKNFKDYVVRMGLDFIMYFLYCTYIYFNGTLIQFFDIFSLSFMHIYIFLFGETSLMFGP